MPSFTRYRWIPRLAISLAALTSCDGRARPDASPSRDAPVEFTRPDDAPHALATPAPVDAGPPPEPIPRRPAGKDEGVFSDLDDQVEVDFPTWLEDAPFQVVRAPDGTLYAYLDGALFAFATSAMGEVLDVDGLGEHDTDGDGIPDQLDALLGAKKAALNAAPYKGGYQKLAYPGGDVPRTEGVCTDTVVRTLRNAGIDLQADLSRDIARSPRSFPMVEKANRHIDHRRVKTLLPYFERHWRSLPIDPHDASSPWLPGDVLFFQIKGDARPDHMGVVADRAGEDGLPLVIHNWTDGYHTTSMSILSFVPVTHRFRLERAPLVFAPASP